MGVTIKVTDEAGVNYDIQWEDHHTLLETLQANGVPVLATCGGNASCATCHGFIDPEHFEASGERTEAEQDLLDMVDDVANEYSRLCCQVEYAPGMDGAEIQMQAAMYSHQPPSSAACSRSVDAARPRPVRKLKAPRHNRVLRLRSSPARFE